MIEINRPTGLTADELWPVLSDVRHWASWLPTVDAVRPVEPERPEEVGASYVLDQPGLPRATWTIIEWTPGSDFTWESRATGVTSTGRHLLVPDPTGTSIRLSLEWTGPLAAVVRALFGRRTRAYVTREAEALDRTAMARRAPA
jgi:hypothetical protein